MNITINGKRCQSISDIRECSSAKLTSFVEEYFNDADYIVAHTSGSTGTPKEIHLQKSDMKVSAANTNRFFGIGPDSVLYLNLSPDYIAGKMMIVRALEANAQLIEETPSNDVLANYNGPGIDLAAFVPSQLIGLLHNPDRLQHIRKMIIGGGIVSAGICSKLVECGIEAYSTYGMTETCSHIALQRIEPMMKPYEMLGDSTIETDARGCLLLNLPSYTIKRIITNDIVEIVDNRHFYWKGRYDNVVNSGGIKLYPEEIEPKLTSLLPKAKFYISSIESDKWGEELAIVIEYPTMGTNIKIGKVNESLHENMKQILPKYSVPKTFIAVSKFEYTTTGKLIRRKFKADGSIME